MGFFRLGKADRAAAGAGKASDDDGEDESQSAATSAAGGDPRGLAASERPLGASERHGGGRSGGLGGELGAVAAVGSERIKKSDRREGGEDLSSGGATGSSAAARSGGGGMPVASSVNDFISKTKSQKRKGLKPSGPELIAYARYLGIDPVADHDLLWIAVEALEAPLPSTWSEHFDSNDRVFYYNNNTRVSCWTHPLEHVYRETYTTIVNFRNSNLSPAERGEKLQRLQAECEQMEQDVHREISLWTEHNDEQGHRFYFNAQEKQSTWTDPRPAQCHILYLKMKLVRVLSSCAGVGGVAAGAAAALAAAASSEASRLAPSLSGTSPRREREGTAGGLPSDLGGKRAKKEASSSGAEPVDQFPRRGQGSADLGVTGQGSARGTGSKDVSTIGGNSLDDDAEDDGERHHHHKHKKKKDKKHKKRDLVESGDDRSIERTNLMHSQSEPAVMGKNREAAPPPDSHEARGLAGGPYPAPHTFSTESESLSQVGHTKVKAGIKLQPLMPITGPTPAVAASSGAAGMHMSSSVPELKPLEKLQPL